MIIKQGFQFLNTFSLSLKDKIMLPVRQSHKISRSVIMLDAIKVMDNPTIRKRLAISLFPYKDMLHHITSFVGMRMRWLAYKNIATFAESLTTFPLRMLFGRSSFQCLYLARFTHFSRFVHFATTLRTYLRVMFRMTQAVSIISISSLLASAISCLRCLSLLYSTIRAVRLLMTTRFKANSTVFAFLVNHLTYQFNSNQAISQAGVF